MPSLCIEVDKRYILRDNKIVRCICVNRKGSRPIICLLESDAPIDQRILAYTIEGKWNQLLRKNDPLDIIAEYKEPQKYTAYIRVDRYGGLSISKYPIDHVWIKSIASAKVVLIQGQHYPQELYEELDDE